VARFYGSQCSTQANGVITDFCWCLQEKESKDARDLIRRLKTEHAEQYAELETLKVPAVSARCCSVLCYVICC